MITNFIMTYDTKTRAVMMDFRYENSVSSLTHRTTLGVSVYAIECATRKSLEQHDHRHGKSQN